MRYLNVTLAGAFAVPVLSATTERATCGCWAGSLPLLAWLQSTITVSASPAFASRPWAAVMDAASQFGSGLGEGHGVGRQPLLPVGHQLLAVLGRGLDAAGAG